MGHGIMLRRIFVVGGGGEELESYIKYTTDSIEVLNNTIANAGDNSIIYFEEGTHDVTESIFIGRSNIKLVGVPNKTILLNGATLGTNGIIRCIGTSDTSIYNIEIEGFVIDGNVANSKTGYGIECQYCGIGFVNSTDAYNSAIVGVSYQNYDGVCIHDCIVENCSSFGIYSRSSNQNCSIYHNIIQNNNSIGIYLITSNNNTISGNTVQNNSGIGIYLDSSNNNTVSGNTVQNNSVIGIYLNSSSSNRISGSTIQNNGVDGVFLNSSLNNTIFANTIQNNAGNGIVISSSSNNNTISANTIQNNGSVGIYLSSSNNNIVSFNSVQSNASYGIYLITTCDRNVISANISKTNTTYDIRINNSTVTYSLVTFNQTTIAVSNVGTNTTLSYNIAG